MTTTKLIPREQWQETFDRFTKRHLRDDLPEAVTIEHLSPDLGDQVQVEAVESRDAARAIAESRMER